MRALLIATLACATTAAFAEPRPTTIDIGVKLRPPAVAAPSSRLVFMHRCPPAVSAASPP